MLPIYASGCATCCGGGRALLIWKMKTGKMQRVVECVASYKLQLLLLLLWLLQVPHSALSIPGSVERFIHLLQVLRLPLTLHTHFVFTFIYRFLKQILN